jgi:hypothetical protein
VKDSESKAAVEPRRRQFTTAALLFVMTLVAWILAVNRWLGPPYGWMTAIPLAIVALLVLITRGRAAVGTVVGFTALCLLGYFLIIGWEPTDPRFLKSLVCLGSFGGAAGGSIHALFMKRWIVGSLSLIASIVSFAAILMAPIAT